MKKKLLKLLNEIIISYVTKGRERSGLQKNQLALLIVDVFKRQMTNPLLKVFSDNNILLQSVPASLTYLFQPPAVQGGPNRFVKRMMEKGSLIGRQIRTQRKWMRVKNMDL